ncbi:zona pellucida sperm-binding protein 4-like [Centropristis striata]|uniref:zona pellucida sperm-binding protein 4-like n=1 Tax=Centropristis striata TaxID=184440 RepID=UPI0027DFC13C|nr:zona pellucida sperm-binding protein 4-like [Centropristis striata]
MAMKFLCGCLLAVVLLGCLTEAQYSKQPQQPQLPKQPQQPQQPQPPKWPQQPQRPQEPQQPQPPKWPQQPQRPQEPQQPQPPKWPQQPQRPQEPQQPQPPKWPQQPQKYTPPKQDFSQKYTPQQAQQPQQTQQTQQAVKQPSQPTESFHTCEVAEHIKIQCGAPDISASDCSAISCCFDGRMCYYGKSVTLQCTKDAQMIVVVARDATLPNIDLETLSFLGSGPNCQPVGTTSAFAIYQYPVTACGTVMMEEPGVIIYENRMASSYEVAIGPYGSITRDSSFELVVQCRYIGTSVEAVVIEVGTVPPPPPVAAPGPLSAELRLGNGVCTTKGCVEEDVAYLSYYVDADYPVVKVLRDPVYVEVRVLERTDPNLVLTLGRCWATSDPYPHSLPQWDLLIDGCPYRDDRYQTALVPVGASSGLDFPTHYRRFVFKMFTFVATGAPSDKKGGPADPGAMTPLKEKVYIHCETAVCQPSLGNNCEPRCFRKRREIAASNKGSFRDDTIVASSQEIVFTDANQRT